MEHDEAKRRASLLKENAGEIKALFDLKENYMALPSNLMRGKIDLDCIIENAKALREYIETEVEHK